MDFTIREGQAGDCTDVSRMIMELAVYEKLPEQVKISHKELEQDGFSDHPFFKLLIAEVSDENKSKDGHTKVGYALYFYSYSSWKGKALYMEDLYVMPEFRGKGIGKALLKRVAQISREQRCCRLQFTVLDWNTPSMEFYLRLGAQDLSGTEGWRVLRFEGDALDTLAEAAPKD
ncbi:thialysine N-epsilon-acetyltransferase isoform X2 [Amia ocellicauda]|uniref:thialysine N-epsilon-acetyltransferase isoform X2 n=1 Tax=Amia ocellicauda TaxID=2972642 RepID=UPI003464C524|nr:SAT2 acetyltransferase [Amia calva]